MSRPPDPRRAHWRRSERSERTSRRSGSGAIRGTC